jgi:hypothetical protein
MWDFITQNLIKGKFPESDKSVIQFTPPFGPKNPIFEVEQDVSRMSSIDRAKAITDQTLDLWKAEKASFVIRSINYTQKFLTSVITDKVGPQIPDTTKANWAMIGDRGELYQKYDAWFESLNWREKISTTPPENSIEAKALREQYYQEREQWELDHIDLGPDVWEKKQAYQEIKGKIAKITELINDRNFY